MLNTLIVPNTYCFSMATLVMSTSLGVIL